MAPSEFFIHIYLDHQLDFQVRTADTHAKPLTRDRDIHTHTHNQQHRKCQNHPPTHPPNPCSDLRACRSRLTNAIAAEPPRLRLSRSMCVYLDLDCVWFFFFFFFPFLEGRPGLAALCRIGEKADMCGFMSVRGRTCRLPMEGRMGRTCFYRRPLSGAMEASQYTFIHTYTAIVKTS